MSPDFGMNSRRLYGQEFQVEICVVKLKRCTWCDQAAREKEAGERQSANTDQEDLPPLNPYNNTLAMPLDDFVNHPAAMEVLHNGAAFQVRSRA